MKMVKRIKNAMRAKCPETVVCTEKATNVVVFGAIVAAMIVSIAPLI